MRATAIFDQGYEENASTSASLESNMLVQVVYALLASSSQQFEPQSFCGKHSTIINTLIIQANTRYGLYINTAGTYLNTPDALGRWAASALGLCISNSVYHPGPGDSAAKSSRPRKLCLNLFTSAPNVCLHSESELVKNMK